MVRLKRRMNAAKYREVLEVNLLQSARDLGATLIMTQSIQPRQSWSGFRTSL